jgi:hypothetical protein
VPIQKYSKLNNNLFKNEVYVFKHSYSTLSKNSLRNDNVNFVKFYENVFDMKKDILNENKSKSGIYMLTNNITKKIYIGQSSDLSNRFKNYFNISYINSKASLTINRALIKYGYSNFSLSILEYCDKSDLLTREQFYFDKLNPEYNILKIAGSSLKSKHSERTKARISKSLKGAYMKEKSALFGNLHTEETKKLMSAISGNSVNIYEKFSSKGFKLIGSFVSARRAGKFLGISGTTVIKYRNSGEIFKDRYKFSSK